MTGIQSVHKKEVEACVSSIKWFNHRKETGSDSVVEKKNWLIQEC